LLTFIESKTESNQLLLGFIPSIVHCEDYAHIYLFYMSYTHLQLFADVAAYAPKLWANPAAVRADFPVNVSRPCSV